VEAVVALARETTKEVFPVVVAVAVLFLNILLFYHQLLTHTQLVLAGLVVQQGPTTERLAGIQPLRSQEQLTLRAAVDEV
jgi:hypothetical protein